MEKYKVGIVGGAGYTGGELLRLLINHPGAELIYVHSKSNAGNPLGQVHSDLEGETSLVFTDGLADDVDVVFLCVGHGEARKFLEENKIDNNTRLIDLSQDFRIIKNSVIANRKFIYGLPELNKEAIKTASNIANPGCFATAIQLGLLPLAKHRKLKAVYSTGITGSTGAGQGLTGSSHFSWRANNIQAYKTLSHQHLKEILQSIDTLQPGFSSPGEQLNFIPWRGDFTRGIFISSQTDCDLTETEVINIYEEYYADHPFVHISKQPIYLKQVVNTNKCFIQLERVGNKLVVHTILDNLLKGASGQAVQNMNLMAGFSETAGLKLKANAF